MISIRHKVTTYPLILSLLFLVTLISFTRAQEETTIEILNSDSMEKDETIGTNAIRYIGNVALKHEETIMYCDSAYFYPDENYVRAYHHIHIEQGDTLDLYGDLLTYDGTEKIARMRHNVKLIDKESVLTTEQLDFNVEEKVGYYFNGGEIRNGDNLLQSILGHYYTRDKLFYFRDSVKITNPEYLIIADTLKYHSVTEVAYFFGPTEIIGEENYIYCENGWYDTRQNISQFNKNAYLTSKGQYIKGDSLYYERDAGIGRAFDNVEIYDSTQNIILKGKFAFYREEPEYALLTDSAQFIQLAEDDTLYAHADTIESNIDSTGLFKIVTASYHVKIFSNEIQGKCDSLSYLESDSVFRFFYDPVLWSEEHQLTAEYIELHLAHKEMDYIDLVSSSFIISQEDTTRFNQIKGRNMVGYFSKNKLVRIEVKGNGQTIYFPKDQEELIGVNKAESSDLVIYLTDGKIERIKFLLKPVATLFPPDELMENELFLRGFVWLNHFRPRTKEEIFIWEIQ
ncbi:MAG: hypothetical protein AMS27_12710 [Bacteroides sp. SM23_62_1]|nr:MAG: hypothetical protein AMS27_12710 [Bacteroides sp. SM23_62_1]